MENIKKTCEKKLSFSLILFCNKSYSICISCCC